MKLAASNIGWNPEHRAQVLPRLVRHDVEGLVIAPTMVFDEGPYAKPWEVSEFRKEVEDTGLVVSAMQSLTYGLQGASLFGALEERLVLTEHLKRQAELAGQLGATSLIFGSPGLRKGPAMRANAVEVFRAVADEAVNNNTKLCIEPLSGYGNEFVKTTLLGISLVRRIDHPGFGLHLDAAAIAGAKDTMGTIKIAQRTVGITSFDASAPELMPLSADETVNHKLIAETLRLSGYAGYVSLEMRPPSGDDPIERYFSEIDYMKEQYTA